MRRAPRYSAGIAALAVNKPDPKVLLDFLAGKFNLTRRSAKAMIDGRSVWVNRRCVWIAGYALRTGDTVEVPENVVNGAKKQSSAARQNVAGGGNADVAPKKEQKRHIRVLWQDETYLVCDKPAGIVSCDDPKSAEAILREQEKIPTLEAVHRLDRDTSGCLMFAKNHAALVAAIEMFKTHKVQKIYHAVVSGDFKLSHVKIDAPIDGQTAVSFVARESYTKDAAFLRVKIETGRTNQIRRHLASIRFPIIGDRVFGYKNARDMRLMRVPRQLLHASTLTLPEPLDPKATIKVHSPLPADFRSALRTYGMGKQ